MAGNGTSFIANNNSNHSGEGGDSGSRTVFNNGQEKEGQCQATMPPPPPPANYSSIAQVSEQLLPKLMIWFKLEGQKNSFSAQCEWAGSQLSSYSLPSIGPAAVKRLFK